MENWITLTPEDLISALSGEEASIYRSALLKEGQEDPTQDIIDSVVSDIRGAVRSCRKSKLDTTSAETIPKSQKHHALALIRYRALTRFKLPISEDRRNEWKSAEQRLRDIAKCQYLIEAPSDEPGQPAPKQTGPAFSKPSLTQTRKDSDGA